MLEHKHHWEKVCATKMPLIKKYPRLFVAFFIGTVLAMFLSSACLPEAKIPAQGIFLGKNCALDTDSRLAKMFIEDYSNPEIQTLVGQIDNLQLNNELLARLHKQHSADFASFYLLDRFYRDNRNKTAQDAYHSFLQEYQQKSPSEADIVEKLKSFRLVFVPGFAWKSDPTTGADFARQRQLMNRLGIENSFVETDEWGASDANAQVVADSIKALKNIDKHLIVVSASKGGLETAIALGGILGEVDLLNVKAWVSVGGILKGSPVADCHLKAPDCWFAGFILWTKGKNLDIVRDISHDRRASAPHNWHFPEHLKIVHYVGAPLANGVSKEIRKRYCYLSKRVGPNDGLTSLIDEMLPGGVVISELGLDHYFRDPEIDLKTLALAGAAISIE